MTKDDIQVQPLSRDDQGDIRALFEKYPYKKSQRRAQGLDAGRLIDYYLAQFENTVRAGHLHWIARVGGEAAALAGLIPDPWHREIYGLEMGKIQPWLNTEKPAAGEKIVGELLAAARTAGFEHLSVRIDGEDFANLHLFEAEGFRLVDVSMKFSRPFPLEADSRWSDGKKWTLREFTDADAPWMRELGSRRHAHSHFLNDPALPADRTRELFAQWVERCMAGLAYRIYIAEDARGQSRGFVIYLRNRGFASAAGSSPLILDYVILDPAVRGEGLGAWLIHGSLVCEQTRGFDYCELRTSQHNHAAVACYEKLGFRLCATDFILHRKF